MSSEMDCNCHQNNLSQNSTIEAVAPELVKWMYNGQIFLTLGGNSLRLAQAVPTMVDRFFPPPVRGERLDIGAATAYADELQDLHEVNWKRFDRAMIESDVDVDHELSLRCRKYKQAWVEFREVFNGWLLNEPGASPALEPHYYAGEADMSVPEFENLKAKAKHAIRNLIVRSMPCRPQTSKWTKFYPCTLVFQLWFQMQFILMLIPIAFSSMTAKIRASPLKYTTQSTQYNSEVSYQQVQGSLLKGFYDGCKTKTTFDLLTIFVLIFEPIAFLTQYFMCMTSVPLRRRLQKLGKSAPWCNLVTAWTSPVTSVLQYYSLLASGKASRLKLLFGRKYADFEAWAEAEPNLLAKFRRGVAVAASLVFARSWHRLMQFPWRLAAITMPEVPEDVVAGIISDFEGAAEEQLDDRFSLKLRRLLAARRVTADSLRRGGQYFSLLSLWVWVVVGTVAAVEFTHARNRSRANAAELWCNFAGKFILQENSRAFSACLKFLSADKPKKRLLRASRPKRVRLPSVRDLFTKEFNSALTSCGLSKQVNDPEYVAEFEIAFAALTQERLQLYEHQVELAKLAANAQAALPAICDEEINPVEPVLLEHSTEHEVGIIITQSAVLLVSQ